MPYRHNRKLSQNTVKIDLKVQLENFGPVKKGAVDLKPLTIFIGPNNSGKSYVAMLIHSILSSENQISQISPFERFSNPSLRISQLFDKDIQKIIKKNNGKEFFAIPANIIKQIRSSLVQDEFRFNLESTLGRNFASPVTELVSTKQDLAKISISNSSKYDILIDKKLKAKAGLKLKVKADSNLNIKYKFKISPKETDYHYIRKQERDVTTITFNKIYANDLLKYDASNILTQSIAKQLKQNSIPAESHYFPAARSGILQGHKALSASIIKSAPFGGIESFQIPQLTGVVSDFISNIILISRRRGLFFKMAEQLESELLHGNIRLSPNTKNTFPEITYKSLDDDEIPLHRTSSTISEIAPLSLYLKYIVSPSSLLIIEEPEAHLHPTNQLIFAKYIVRMIRAGLNVLITTHSVFLLEELGKFMLASKIESATRKKLGYVDDYLLHEEVSPYVFVQERNGRHVISPIETNDEEGISQEEFVKVNDLLYIQSLKLQQKLPGNMK